jgi:hypothetical protein
MFSRKSSKVPVLPCTGEAADDQMRLALLQSGCRITESAMIAGRPGIWLHCFNVRRPRRFRRLFGYGRELHLTITAEVVRPLVCAPAGGRWFGITPSTPSQVSYTVGCMRVDGRGRYKSWKCNSLSALLASL